MKEIIKQTDTESLKNMVKRLEGNNDNYDVYAMAVKELESRG